MISLMTVLLITIILYGLAIIILLGIFLYNLGKASTDDNPKNALIFRLNGNHLEKPRKATYHSETPNAIRYNYNSDEFVIVPKRIKADNKLGTKAEKIRDIFYRGKKIIFLNNIGGLIANDFETGQQVNDSEMLTILKEVFKADIGGGAVRAVKSSKQVMFNIILVIIALCIGIIGTYGVISYQNQLKPQAQTPTPIPAQNQQVIPAGDN